MPNTMVAQVTQQTQSRGLSFALLKELAFRHHPRYGYAFPRLQTLADVLRVSVRTVQRHIQKLEALGELRVIRGGGRSRNSRYYLSAFETMTTRHPSNQTSREKSISAGSMPCASDPPKAFSLSREPTETVLRKWLTRGSRLWNTIVGEPLSLASSTGAVPPCASPRASGSRPDSAAHRGGRTARPCS
jgi:DNA-binding MarR family transcriptional regulator